MKFSEIPFLESSTITQHVHRVSLHDESMIWFLEKGDLDLFAIERVHGKTEGKHHFVQEFNEGALLFGFPLPERNEIIAVVEPGAILKKIDRKIFDSYVMQDPILQQSFLPLLNAWVGSLHSPFVPPQKEKEGHIFHAKESPFILKKGEKMIPEHLISEEEILLINWVQLEKGALALLGWQEVAYETPSWIPLRANLWLQAISDSTLRGISSIDFIQQNHWIQALTQFHRIFLKGIETSSQILLKREKELIEQRTHLEEKSLNESFLTLAWVLKHEEPFFELRQDPIFLACKRVGLEYDIQFEMPREGLQASSIAGQIKEICESSNARFRQVLLSGNWFKEDSGNLVGFFGPDQKPVALLCNERRKYRMIDPITNEERNIDKTLASHFAPIAFEFYGSFANEKISRMQALKFAFFNQKKKISLIFVFGMMISLLNLFLPFGSKVIFGTAIPQLNTNLVWEAGLAIFAAAISSAIYQLSQGFLIFRTNSHSGNRFEAAIWDRVLKLPARFFKLFSVGDLYARVNGFATLRRAFGNYYTLLFLNVFFSFFYLIAMCLFSLKLALMAVLGFALILLIFYLCLIRMVRFQRVSYGTKGTLNGFILQVIAGIAKLRVSGAEKHAFAYWAKLYAAAKKNDLKSQYYQTVIETVFAMMPTFSILLIFSLVIYFVFQTTHSNELKTVISTGNFFGFITAFSIFSTAIFSSIPAITYLYRVIKPIWSRGFVIFETEPEVTPAKKSIGILQGSVTVEQIFFRYNDRAPYLLKKVTFKVAPGEFIGIVGPSGSGKSTLVRLLLGFETPQIGTISYDGIDLTHVDLRSVRRQLGVVLQHGSILTGTIYENLVCGGVYSQEQVERAIHLSEFDQDLWNFPMGLHTVLATGGATLSGGQRQRLLIARALISDPKILIFDEATSALDSRTQMRLSKNIGQLNMTRIVVAHRLNTIRHSDRIYVIDQGEIVDQGTFDTLASRPGLFSQLVARQKI